MEKGRKRALKRTTGEAKGHYGLGERPLHSLKTKGVGERSERKGPAVRCSPPGEMTRARSLARSAAGSKRQEVGRASPLQPALTVLLKECWGQSDWFLCRQALAAPLHGTNSSSKSGCNPTLPVPPRRRRRPAGSQGGSLTLGAARKSAASEGWAFQERLGDWC